MNWFSKANPTPLPGAVEWVDRPWGQALVLVCQECDGAPGLNGADGLKAAKATVRSVASKKQARVTGSGCLDVCPKGGIAVALSADGAPTRCLVVRSLSNIHDLSEVLS